ncbi:MAG: right-handed parallel beta-helix repeat-containing protein [Promethearchaeota archaeon]
MKNSSFSRKKIIIIMILIISIITPITLILILSNNFNQNPNVRYVGGTLTKDETWSGFIHVSDNVNVPQGITLTILPGTFIEFEHYRGYKENKKIGLSINGGTIKAIGTPEKQIWFTSDAEDPINGDWGGISCSNTNNSVFQYVIVEFAIIGIEQFDSAVNVTHSIIRWVNTEGLYAEMSKPFFEYNLIYGNTYHEIALEQYNHDVIIRNNIFGGGHFGIHSEATNVTIEGNFFVNYSSFAITAGQYSNLIIEHNKFKNITIIFGLDHTTTNITLGNDLTGTNNSIPIPQLDFPNSTRVSLNYIPGDPEDKYLYVYPAIDETREIINRLENETTFGWSLTYANGSLWRFDHRSNEIGSQQDFIKINITTGKRFKIGNNILVNPRGLTYDGHYFWVNDFTLLKIFKFKINSSNFIEILDSFDIPHKEKGGLMGLATDGTFLYLPSRDGSILYKVNKSGSLIDEISITNGFIAGSITWTGEYFWSCAGLYLVKLTPDGTIIGKIYPPAWETIGLAWDGTYLWTVQKTCELWFDGKVFQINILNDQVIDG